MNVKTIRTGLYAALFLSGAFSAPLYAAPACKGPNKNDPGCGEPAPAAPPAVVDSATVDWLNQKIVVRGASLTTVTSFGLGAFPGPLPTANVTDSELDLLFGPDLATEVQGQGSYVLQLDSTPELTVFIESQIIDPAATGCPCEVDWIAELGGLWGAPATDCLEIAGPGANDPADISGTILSVPGDPEVYPQYPIGASFYPGVPGDSVCRLVRINGDLSLDELVNYRINENQQDDCRDLLDIQVCSSITPIP